MTGVEIIEEIKKLESEFSKEIEKASDEKEIEEIKLLLLGKKGKLTSVLKGLGALQPQEKAEAGKAANELKISFENKITERKEQIEEERYAKLADTEWFDVTAFYSRFPAKFIPADIDGAIHPITATQRRLEEIFTSMGFSILDGPQVETDFYNFGALNFTDDHPAREMQDTFYTEQNHLLRTHTSAVQARGLKKLKPPLRMIVPGRVFRYEEIDASHEHTFYQMEGMVIDKEVSVSHLLFLMHTLLDEIFGRKVKIRLRPGYFPFVEPGFELDMSCLLCAGQGCAVCKKTGWVEVLPCGLVHPNVIEAGGLDPNEWQGAAFGLGLNRLVMMEHGIEDIRHFQNPNPSFLSQFIS